MIDKIKEAIDWLKGDIEYGEFCEKSAEHVCTLIDLAERYIACGEKMPAKINNEPNLYDDYFVDGYNTSIRECTLITTKLLAEKEAEINQIKEDAYNVGVFLNDKIIARDAEISGLNAKLAEKDERISELEEEVKSLETSMMGDEYYIEGLKGELAAKDSELYDIKSGYEVRLDKANREIERLKYSVLSIDQLVVILNKYILCSQGKALAPNSEIAGHIHKAQQDKLKEVK